MAKTLTLDNALSDDRKPVKIDGESTGLLIGGKDVHIEGDSSVNGNATIIGDLTVTGNALISKNATLDASGNLTLKGTLAVNGDTITTDGHMTLDSAGAVILDSDNGRFVAKKASVEFSVANSAFAGMILGYRMIGEDAVHSTYTLTTSMVVPDSDMTVRFIAPPSGTVEVMVQVFFDGTSNRAATFGLSDNATYNSIGDSYQQQSGMADETDNYAHQHYWTITGLTAGNTYNYWFGASANGGYLSWGGTSAGRFPDFIMKVTALPVAVSDFAEYD